MNKYWVEGIFTRTQNQGSGRKNGLSATEVFARGIWAETPQDALKEATRALEGGKWTEPPHIVEESEEQRMRSRGEPMLPGF